MDETLGHVAGQLIVAPSVGGRSKLCFYMTFYCRVSHPCLFCLLEEAVDTDNEKNYFLMNLISHHLSTGRMT